MPRRQRLAVAFLFAMGIVVTIAGIVRTWFIYKSLITTYDNTWYASFPIASCSVMLISNQVRLPSMDCCRGGNRSRRHLRLSPSTEASSLQDSLQSFWNSDGWCLIKEEVHWIRLQLQDVNHSCRTLTRGPPQCIQSVFETESRGVNSCTRPRPRQWEKL
jgi:hypothetical protein